MLMIRPLFARAICRQTALQVLNAPLRLTASTRSKSSSVICSSSLSRVTPALLTRMSMRPKSSPIRRNGFLDERKVGHVAFVGRGADAEGLRFGDRFGRALVRAGVHDGDVGAVLRRASDRDGRADAARAAGDDRRFAFEKHKLLSFPFFFVVRLRRLHAERKRLGVLHVEDLRLGQNAPDQAATAPCPARPRRRSRRLRQPYARTVSSQRTGLFTCAASSSRAGRPRRDARSGWRRAAAPARAARRLRGTPPARPTPRSINGE